MPRSFADVGLLVVWVAMTRTSAFIVLTAMALLGRLPRGDGAKVQATNDFILGLCGVSCVLLRLRVGAPASVSPG